MMEREMPEKRSVQDWKSHIQPALISKQSEFRLIGYDEVTEEEIWQCLKDKIWKGNPEKQVHEVIQDIFHLPVNTYMNYIQMDALQVKEDDLMSSIEALTKK